MAPWTVWVEGGFWCYRWFVYITTLLLREASRLLYCIVGHPNPASAPSILLVLLEPQYDIQLIILWTIFWIYHRFISEGGWTCWLTSAVSRWSRSSVSLTLSWRRRTRARATSSTIWACRTSGWTAPPTRTSSWLWWPTPHIWRPSTQWCRARPKPSSITAETRTERRSEHVSIL